MKKYFKRIVASCLSLIMLTTLNAAYALEESVPSQKQDMTKSGNIISVNEYPKNSRERYVASLALQLDISFEEADQLEALSASSIYRLPDEKIKYETIDMKAGTITNGTFSQDVYIATEVRYLYSNVTSSAKYIEEIGNPIIYLPGVDPLKCSFLDSEPNIEKYSTSGRISYTTVCTFEVEGLTISVGGDILNVSTTIGGCTVTSRAKTFAITFDLTDLP